MKLSKAQQRALSKFKRDEVKCAYQAGERLSTLRILVKHELLKDVTPPGIGGMFFPDTHFQFKRTGE